MSFWDQQYAGAEYRYGTAPNAFLVEQADRLPPAAEVLVPGDGEGRNGVWLARQGYRVTTVDNSAIGLTKARALAEAAGVTLEAIQADLAHWQPRPACADAIVLTFVHLPAACRTAIHRRLAAALRPGGWLILEAFHPTQLGRSSGGPQTLDMLYTAAQLQADFAPLLREKLAWEGEVTLDEGPGHRGPAQVTRWLGQRAPD